MEYLCLIPARGGSKGVPGKNLRDVAGKPLIAWSVEQALAAPEVGRVVVTTDSPEIAEVARSFGAEVPVLRPADLAQDHSPSEDALLHMIKYLAQSEKYRSDAVLMLQPTAPVRKAGSLSRAIARFEDTSADSLLSVREIHPFLWRNPDDGQAMYDIYKRPRRQDVPADQCLYEETGSIYITRTDLLLTSGNRLGGKVVLFPMDQDESYDVDTAADLAVVDVLIRIAGLS